jgi:hypothetical protein
MYSFEYREEVKEVESGRSGKWKKWKVESGKWKVESSEGCKQGARLQLFSLSFHFPLFSLPYHIICCAIEVMNHAYF